LDFAYKTFVESLFTFFQKDKLIFFGKFGLFPTLPFMASSGIACAIIFNLLLGLKPARKFVCILISIVAFLIILAILSYISSTIMIAECTVCQNGVRRVGLGSIDFDWDFIISLAAATILSTIYSQYQRKKRKIT